MKKTVLTLTAALLLFTVLLGGTSCSLFRKNISM